MLECEGMWDDVTVWYNVLVSLWSGQAGVASIKQGHNTVIGMTIAASQ